jgi:hypothetical protein
MMCLGCGEIGAEWKQRRPKHVGVPLPTPWVRVCPPCFENGVRVIGPHEEA